MMYYLLTERPLQASLGMLIMISGLVIYAMFHKRAASGAAISAPGRE
jgi:APA family basic amino acid/polyamine antiporter